MLYPRDVQWTVENGVISVRYYGDPLLTLHMPVTDNPEVAIVRAALEGFNEGMRQGEIHGRVQIQSDLRRLLDVPGNPPEKCE
jgi:hypothetical protein